MTLNLPVQWLPGADEPGSLSDSSQQNFDAIKVAWPTYSPAASLNVKDYGARGDGVTDDAAAIRAAYAALSVVGGYRSGRLVFPGAAGEVYKIGSVLNFNDSAGVIFEGAGGGAGYPYLRWKGGAGSGPMIACNASFGLDFRDIGLTYDNAAYNGNLVSFSAAGSDIRSVWFNNCYIGGLSGATGAAALVYLDNVIASGFKRTKFANAASGIVGNVAAGRYTTTITVNDRCEFNGLATAAIYNPHFNWEIVGNVFEPSATGAAVGIISDLTAYTRGTVISGNYFGDVISGTGHYIWLRPSGLQISGNYMDVLTGGQGTTPIELQDLFGTVVSGNNITGPATMATAVKLSGAAAVGLQVTGNYTNAVDPLTPTASPWTHIASGLVMGNGSSGTNRWTDYVSGDGTRVELFNQYLRFDAEFAAAGVATAGLYVSSADHKLYFRDSSGVDHVLY